MQTGADLVVRQPLGHQDRDFTFAFGEGGDQGPGRRVSRGWCVGGDGDEGAGHVGGQDIFTCRHPLDGLDQPGRVGVLEQEGVRAELQGPHHVVVGVEGGQHDDPRSRLPAAHLLQGREPIETGHPHVQQHDVDGLVAQGRERLGAIARLPGHVDAVLPLEDEVQSGADHRVVIDQGDGDHAVPSGV